MLTVVTWKWDDGIHPKKGLKFGLEHLRVLANMLERHLHVPFELVCVTDQPEKIDKRYRIVKIWTDYKELGGCFRRLKMFSPDAEKIFGGDRLLSIDLDTVIVGDMTPLVDRPEDFIIWGEHWRRNPYCGSMWLLRAGSRSTVWTEFDPKNYPPTSEGRYPLGTDQWRINDCLYPSELMWTTDDGVYNFGMDIRIRPNVLEKIKGAARKKKSEWIESKVTRAVEKSYGDSKAKNRTDREARLYAIHAERKTRAALMRENQTFLLSEMLREEQQKQGYVQKHGDGKVPEGARVIFFNGKDDPSQPFLQKAYPWIAENWR